MSGAVYVTSRDVINQLGVLLWDAINSSLAQVTISGEIYDEFSIQVTVYRMKWA